jgi:bifunctional DNA-binding transcriptional regulator/antitoxin component of YhaV-PrlF toxin-antitoxin module
MKELTAVVEVDGQGRVTIPPVIRKAMKLQKGSIITITISDFENLAGEKNENPLRVLVPALA